MIDKKIVKYKQLGNIIPKLTGKRVLVGGCFDLLHIGHVRFLKAAKKEGDILIIALEGDEFIQKIKKRQPVHHHRERAEILSSLKMVDIVILLPFFHSYADYLRLVKIVKPDILAVTENDPQIENKQKQVNKIGGKLKIVTPYINGITSSKLIKKLTKLFF